MCGIAGIITKNLNNDAITTYSQKFLDNLEHRGPDDKGTWVDKDSGLLMAHRRLSIHDLSTHGAQPMHSPSNKFCIVFNGEIYNYLEIRLELSAKGHSFKGHSDTEVLITAIEEWGLNNTIKKLIGMFAFALWDKSNKILHLCRDRLGEKPLYYGWVNGSFLFSSEIRAIKAVCPKNSLTISSNGLHGFLKYGYISSPNSIYSQIKKLPPSTVLSLPLYNLSNSTPEPVKYWSLHDIATKGLANQIQEYDEAFNLLDSQLHTIIEQQLNADVDVGLFLSGGIDSTIVTAIAQNVSKHQVKTFTIGFNEKEYDESPYAEKIAKYLNTSHTTIKLSSSDARDIIPLLPGIYDEPFADSSQIPAYLVSKLAKEHVTVCLSGDGGDELFAGYNRYLLTKKIWDKTQHVPFLLKKLLSGMILHSPVGLRNTLISALYKNNQGSIDTKIQKLAGLLQFREIMDAYDYLCSYWYRPGQIIRMENTVDTRPILLPENASFTENAMYIDQLRYLEGDNLAKTDRASMAVSLETRLPLLSHELVELSWKIPLHMKVHNNSSKWILRNLLYKYVPKELIDRPKMGFSVPIANWLRNELRDWAEDLLEPLKTNQNEYLNSNHIMQAWDEHITMKCDHSNRLWTVLMFLAWLR